MTDLEPLMTVAEAAVKLRKTPDWLTKKVRSGEVPSRKVGQSRYLTDSDLAAYLARVQTGGQRFPQSERSAAQRRRRD